MSSRIVRVLLVASVVALASCGSRTADDADLASGDRPVDDAELATRAEAVGTTADVVRVPDLDGFEAIPMSAGVYGAEGFSAAYVNDDGAIAMVMVEPTRMTDETCPETPVYGSYDPAPTDCAADDHGWYRTSGDQHEYAARLDGIDVRVAAPTTVLDADALRRAARGAHVPTSDELDAVLPQDLVEQGTGDQPIERGDLPPHGDGAPINPDGTGQEG